MATNELKASLNRVLIDGLPQGLKASIDRLLAAGESKAGILARVRQTAGNAKLTVAAVEAYLASK